MLYKEALSYIMNISRYGSDYGLERMQMACDFLNNPEDSLKFVHVAGTNGKGSVTAYITSILKENGYKVGTYNSPYIYNYRERFLINNEMASEELVAKYLEIVKNTIEKLRENNTKYYLTAFEIETVAAFLMFKDVGCDIVVLEVGLGGRLDATNVIKNKELAIITAIGLDHCALLGNTYAEIAREKASIIKDKAVTFAQSEEVMAEIRKVAKEVVVAPEGIVISRDVDEGQVICIDGINYTTRLLGEYQAQNLSLAIAAIEELKKQGWNITLKNTLKGVFNAKWPVRFEVKKIDNKYIVLDGSHNPQGASSLVRTVKAYFTGKKIGFVIGMLADKDMEGVLKQLLPLSNKTTFIQSTSPRAATMDQLIDLAKKLGYESNKIENINDAIKDNLNSDLDIIIVCGSLTLFENIQF